MPVRAVADRDPMSATARPPARSQAPSQATASTACVVAPGPTPGTAADEHGRPLPLPAGWVLLPPGDAVVTRRVKAAGPHWVVQEKKGRRTFSRGVLAPGATVEEERARRTDEKKDPAYQEKLAAGRARRAKQQEAYVEDFTQAVRRHLAFAPRYAKLERALAERVSAHATPVGSGTVARTKRIPVEARAEAAVIAWMRHQTTAYDRMTIRRQRGERRNVRRELAKRSRGLLDRYRAGQDVVAGCPLWAAMQGG